MRSAIGLLLSFVGCLALGYGGVTATRAATGTPSSATVGASPSPPATGATAAPAPTPSLDLTALAQACRTVPAGAVAAYLQPATLIHGTEPDPRTQQTLPVLRVTVDAEIPAARPPFSIAAVVQEPGKAHGDGDRPVDTMGSVQFWIYWDGEQLHKGLRRWTSGAWSMAVDNQAGSLTIELHSHSAAFHSGDVKPGSTFALVTADGQGCAALGLDVQGRPASGF